MNFTSAQQLIKAFEEVYNDIYITRFWGLPITNHRLSVKGVGLRETNEFYSFCLITPWMLNRIVVLKREDVTNPIIEGMRLDQLEKLGKFFVTNVISPMNRFTSMEKAIRKGERVAEELFAALINSDNDQPQNQSRREFFRKIIPTDTKH